MSYTLEKNQQWQDIVINGKNIKAPSTWVAKKISDFAKTSIGSTPTKTGANYEGPIPWITISDLKKKVVSTYSGNVAALKNVKILPAQSLIGSFKMSVGRFGFLSNPAATNEAIIAITPSGTKEALSYLYYVLPHVFKSNASLNGQGLQLLNTQTIKGLGVLLPPLSEQTAIANILSDQESLIAHCNDLIALHEKRFAYLSDELLSGRLRLEDDSAGGVRIVMNDEWREVEVNGEMVEVPARWDVQKLTTYATINSGQSPESNLVGTQGLDFHQGNSLFGNKYIQLSPRKITLANATKIAKAGELLFSVRAPVGEVNFTQTDICIGRGLAAFSTTQSTSFLYYALQYHKTDFKKLSTGTTFEGISAKNIGLFELEVPPIPEQIAIANVLSDQEALITQYKTLRDAEKKRFDWLSDALLSGTYRVKVES